MIYFIIIHFYFILYNDHILADIFLGRFQSLSVVSCETETANLQEVVGKATA